MHHGDIPADHRNHLYHVAVQETGQKICGEPLPQISKDSHQKQYNHKTVSGLYHQAALPFLHAFRAVEQKHDASLQKILHYNRKDKVEGQPPAIHQEEHAAVYHGEQIDQDLHEQSTDIGVDQHPFGRNRRRKEKVHIAPPVHQPPAFCVGD